MSYNPDTASGGRDPESPPEDVARVRLTAGLRSFYDRLDAAKSTENLADDDIQELSKILHYAVCAQSKQHQASPQMLGKFVDAIFKNWWKGSGDLDPPRDVIGAPYRTSQYHFEFRDRDEADPRDSTWRLMFQYWHDEILTIATAIQNSHLVLGLRLSSTRAIRVRYSMLSVVGTMWDARLPVLLPVTESRIPRLLSTN